MKKLSLISAALMLLGGLSLSAQTALVKEVERQIKDNTQAADGLKKIQPALTNPETASDANTWVIAAKAAVGVYDRMKIQEGLSPQGLTSDQKKQGGAALNSAFDYLFAALPLDSVPDAKGNVKTKKSKEIVKLLKDNYSSLQQSGIWLYEAQDYPGAIKAWEFYSTLPKQPVMANSGIVAHPDSIVAQIMNYEVLAMVLDKQNEAAVAKSRQVQSMGYKDIDVYRYGLAAAQEAADTAAIVEFAQAGYDKYGTQDMSFIGQLINVNLAKNNYDKCVELLNAAIEANADPSILPTLYDIRGTVNENRALTDQAIADFRKSVEVDPNFAKGWYDVARMIYNKALKDDEGADEAARQASVYPALREAAQLFEKAYQLDEQNLSNIPGILYRLYYRIEGEDGTNTLLWEKLQ